MSFLSNFRKTFFVYAISLFLVAGAFLLPQVASATVNTIDELRSQIQALLAQIVSLQEQISRMSSTTPPTPSCVAPTYNLYLGLNDNETEGQVTGLQKFLARYPDIYPDAQITGYFGPLTEQAVKRFQAKHGIVSSGSPETTGYGVVGPATRAKIRELCGTPTSPPIPVPPSPLPSIRVLSPNGGETVVSRGSLDVRWVSSGIPTGNDDKDIGIGICEATSVLREKCSEFASFLNSGYARVSLTGGLAADPGQWKIMVVVLDSPNWSVYDTSDAPFSIVAPGSTNLPPTISGVSGPTSLNVGQSGTWMVNAHDPENGSLTYSVNWGANESADSRTVLLPASQTATFTHTYTQQGIFNPTFTVTDNGGLSERTSVSVNVGGATPTSSLNVQVSGSYMDGTVLAGTTGAIFAIMDLTVMGSEPIQVLKLPFAHGIDPNVGRTLTNFSLYDQQGRIVAGPTDSVDNQIIFTDAFLVPVGRSVYTLKANVSFNPAVTGLQFYTYPASWTVVIGTGSNLIIPSPPNNVVFGAVNIVKPSWSVSLDPSSPTEKWVVAGSTDVPITVLRFSATADIKLSRLRLQLRSPATLHDITAISLYDGGNLLIKQTKPAFVGGVEDFSFPPSSFPINKNFPRLMTIKVDVAPVGSSYSLNKPGQLVAIDYDGDGTALGKNTGIGFLGAEIISSTVTDTTSSGVRYFRSLPIVERLPLPVTTLTSGNNIIYKFKVTADPAYDIALRKFTFQTVIDGNNTLANVTLWNTTDNRRVAAAQPTVGPIFKILADNTALPSGQGTSTTLCWDIVTRGQSRTYELRADITSLGMGAVTTKLLGDSQYPAFARMGTAAQVQASPSNSVIWSDFSADTYTTHSITTEDWTNGFKMPGLLSTGSDSSTLSGGGCCITDTTPPSIPTNLSATSLPTSQIGLSWSSSADNVGVTGYRVERCTGSTCTNFVQIAVPTVTSYVDSSITLATTYRYRVRAVDAAGNLSGYSSIISITSDSALPGTVWRQEFASADTVAGWVGNWTRRPGTDIFDALYKNSVSNTITTGVLTPAISGSTITVPTTSFTDGGKCWYTGTLSADRKIITGTYTCGVSNTRPWKVYIDTPLASDTTPPSAPSYLVGEFYLVPKLSLAWNVSTDNVGVMGYRIERCTGASCTNFAQIGTVSLVNNYTDASALSGTAYRYRVRAVDAAGNLSVYSNIVTETPTLIYSAPSSSSVANVLESIRAQLLEIMAKLQSMAQ